MPLTSGDRSSAKAGVGRNPWLRPQCPRQRSPTSPAPLAAHTCDGATAMLQATATAIADALSDRFVKACLHDERPLARCTAQ